MKDMCLVEVKRIVKQKFIYFFLVAFCVASYAYSYLITSADLYDMLNVDPVQSGGARFPEFMMRFYVITIGPLFMSFITALYVNEDNMAGMLKQPLLHAKTRKDILSKFISLCGFNVFMMAAIYGIVYIIGYLKWGSEIFSNPQFMITLQKFVLIILNLIVIQAFILLISLYSKHTVILVVTMFCVSIVDSLICNNIPYISRLIMFNYSTHYYILIHEGDANLFFKITGIIYDIVFFVLFYYLAVRKKNENVRDSMIWRSIDISDDENDRFAFFRYVFWDKCSDWIYCVERRYAVT